MQFLPGVVPFSLVPINHILIFLVTLIGKFSCIFSSSFYACVYNLSLSLDTCNFRTPVMLSLPPCSAGLILPCANTVTVASELTSSLPVFLLSLIGNCLNLPFGTQGRWKRLDEAYFLQIRNRGHKGFLCPGATQDPSQFQGNRPSTLANSNVYG